MTATVARPHTPESESAVLFRRLLGARRMAELGHENARIAAVEAAALQAALEIAEAEYRTNLQERQA